MCVCVDLREKPPAKKEGGGRKGEKQQQQIQKEIRKERGKDQIG